MQDFRLDNHGIVWGQKSDGTLAIGYTHADKQLGLLGPVDAIARLADGTIVAARLEGRTATCHAFKVINPPETTLLGFVLSAVRPPSLEVTTQTYPAKTIHALEGHGIGLCGKPICVWDGVRAEEVKTLPESMPRLDQHGLHRYALVNGAVTKSLVLKSRL